MKNAECKQITSLLNALNETLPALPGFQSLSLFGSLAEGRADAYSDIDCIVTTDDLPNAKVQLFGLLEEIGPIDFCWAISLRPDEWNPTIAFHNQSYYHRLDIGLTDASDPDRTISTEQTKMQCNETQIPGAYIPEYGSMGHFLLGQFLGCLRYLKARKRGQFLTCYRFASAASQWHLTYKYALLTKNPEFCSKLSTGDYKKLDALLPISARDALLSAFDFSSPVSMDEMVLTMMRKMLEDGILLATMQAEAIPVDVFNRIIAFVAEELS